MQFSVTITCTLFTSRRSPSVVVLHGSFGPLLFPYNSDDRGPTVLQL